MYLKDAMIVTWMAFRRGRRMMIVTHAVCSFCIICTSLPDNPRVGGPAPPLLISQWFNGEPVNRFEKGKIYVLDLWGTWCAPCLSLIPHMSELQQRYANQGVIVIGLTGDDDYGTTLDGVKQFLTEKRSRIGYRIAYDQGRKTHDAWMAVEKRAGWPWAFIVDREGRVAFVGHPSTMDPILESIVAGTYDLAAATEAYANRVKALQAVDRMYEAMDRADPEQVMREFNAAVEADRPMASEYPAWKMFSYLLVKLDRPQEAYAFGRRAVEGFSKDNLNTLSRIAQEILKPEIAAGGRELDLAAKAAQQANRLTEGKDPEVLAQLARIASLQGDPASAIQFQTDAIAAMDPSFREQNLAEYQETLRGYERQKADPDRRTTP